MTPFNLQIITPNGYFFNGEAESVIVRTTVGDKGILARHEPYAAALGTGKIRVLRDGSYHLAALSSGIIKVGEDKTVILAQSCEWSENIDIKRAEFAKKAAEEKLSDANLSANEIAIAEFKLKRAINRLHAVEK
ncbi:MAG: ATP synthase F1 subunit epsilon [Oscillospiraceae bacterium]|jgi:F-type H+-transporting ATPase subunit epsilon|nr:ATP synthase F1 subunit epsilon [Oscillospiraceae bacterium]